MVTQQLFSGASDKEQSSQVGGQVGQIVHAGPLTRHASTWTSTPIFLIFFSVLQFHLMRCRLRLRKAMKIASSHQ